MSVRDGRIMCAAFHKLAACQRQVEDYQANPAARVDIYQSIMKA